INTDLAPTVSPRVIAEVREFFDSSCEVVKDKVSTLVLDEIEVIRESIDQGYVEDHYSMNFKVVFKEGREIAADVRLYIDIVDQIEDRSGRLETYVTDMRTEMGRNGHPLCHF
ncbi:MAG: hypothetical protein ACLGHN_15365, partial [Bacteriovoracia bacterium]